MLLEDFNEEIVEVKCLLLWLWTLQIHVRPWCVHHLDPKFGSRQTESCTLNLVHSILYKTCVESPVYRNLAFWGSRRRKILSMYLFTEVQLFRWCRRLSQESLGVIILGPDRFSHVYFAPYDRFRVPPEKDKSFCSNKNFPLNNFPCNLPLTLVKPYTSTCPSFWVRRVW